jgi:hypothetical protein
LGHFEAQHTAAARMGVPEGACRRIDAAVQGVGVERVEEAS